MPPQQGPHCLKLAAPWKIRGHGFVQGSFSLGRGDFAYNLEHCACNEICVCFASDFICAYTLGSQAIIHCCLLVRAWLCFAFTASVPLVRRCKQPCCVLSWAYVDFFLPSSALFINQDINLGALGVDPDILVAAGPFLTPHLSCRVQFAPGPAQRVPIISSTCLQLGNLSHYDLAQVSVLMAFWNFI